MKENEIFNRLEIAFRVYSEKNPDVDITEINKFVDWLYKEYGMVRKEFKDE